MPYTEELRRDRLDITCEISDALKSLVSAGLKIDNSHHLLLENYLKRHEWRDFLQNIRALFNISIGVPGIQYYTDISSDTIIIMGTPLKLIKEVPLVTACKSIW